MYTSATNALGSGKPNQIMFVSVCQISCHTVRFDRKDMSTSGIVSYIRFYVYLILCECFTRALWYMWIDVYYFLLFVFVLMRLHPTHTHTHTVSYIWAYTWDAILAACRCLRSPYPALIDFIQFMDLKCSANLRFLMWLVMCVPGALLCIVVYVYWLFVWFTGTCLFICATTRHN